MWPGCASGCHGQKHEVHLPSCAQKYFQHSLHEVWKTKPSSEAQHSWLPTPKTWSDHTAFGNFCLANTTLAKLNLFCHQELHNQLRRGSVCVSASPSKCEVLLRQVYASNLNKRSYSELFWRFPEAFFHLHNVCLQPVLEVQWIFTRSIWIKIFLTFSAAISAHVPE